MLETFGQPSPIATAALETVGQKIGHAAIKLSSKAFDKAKVALEIGFSSYLEKSYNRCRYYKTLLNPYQPCDLDETYINVGLREKSRGSSITDVELLNKFLDGERVVISGLAGCGKSMLMRYATLHTFSSSHHLPLFIELRKINNSSHHDLMTLIFDECTPSGRGVTLAQFKLALRSGLFALILDGFDEVEYSLRRSISEQIKSFALDFPAARLIISSRPDSDVFTSWSEFKIYDVDRFSKEQTRRLVNLTPYDSGVKERFVLALEEKLFNTHGDFLQSPLLTIIMLLTFEEFAEIPNKMHAFYARAFDTLFQKHDADKEQFVRKIKTNLSREDFKLVLSCLCAISYLDEYFSFDRESLDKYVSKGIDYAKNVAPNLRISSYDFISDLRDAVCLIQEDGLNFVFVHRSFQEYFTAVFLEKIDSAKIRRLADKLAERFNDNVLPMALDMSREKMEVAWLIPTLDRYIEIFDPKGGDRSTGAVFKRILGPVSFYADTNKVGKRKTITVSCGFHEIPKDIIGPLEIICRNERDRLGPAFPIERLRGHNIDYFAEKILDSKYKRRKSFSLFSSFIFDSRENSTSRGVVIDVNERDSWWLDAMGVNITLDKLHSVLIEIRSESLMRANKRKDILDRLLD